MKRPQDLDSTGSGARDHVVAPWPGAWGEMFPDGVGVGSASEATNGRSALRSSATDPMMGSMLTGSAVASGDVRIQAGDAYPYDPAPEALRSSRTPSPFAVLSPQECAEAACGPAARARDFMVHFVKNGATWPAMPQRRAQ